MKGSKASRLPGNSGDKDGQPLKTARVIERIEKLQPDVDLNLDLRQGYYEERAAKYGFKDKG